MIAPSKEDIFGIDTKERFNQVALAMFRYQFEHNPVYRSFCDLLYKHPSEIHRIQDIPFLPIAFFKSREVITGHQKPEITFTSSGTTQSTPSKHHVVDITLYKHSFLKHFKQRYGNPEDFVILALLPSYLERTGSSLIYMADALINLSNNAASGFYLNDLEALAHKLEAIDATGKKVLLLGVSFALLDLVEKHRFNLKNTIVMETGGMKGRRKEIIREELHDILQTGFGVNHIHSEYGMTELLSQAYARGERFVCPPWMQVLVRDPEDPLTLLPPAKTGGLNIIDLANRDSCAFIATQDLGQIHTDGSFTVLGRFDHSDIRGCNLMSL